MATIYLYEVIGFPKGIEIRDKMEEFTFSALTRSLNCKYVSEGIYNSLMDNNPIKNKATRIEVVGTHYDLDALARIFKITELSENDLVIHNNELFVSSNGRYFSTDLKNVEKFITKSSEIYYVYFVNLLEKQDVCSDAFIDCFLKGSAYSVDFNLLRQLFMKGHISKQFITKWNDDVYYTFDSFNPFVI